MDQKIKRVLDSLTNKEKQQLKRNCDYKSHITNQLLIDGAAVKSLLAKGYLQNNGMTVELTQAGKDLCTYL